MKLLGCGMTLRPLQAMINFKGTSREVVKRHIDTLDGDNYESIQPEGAK